MRTSLRPSRWRVLAAALVGSWSAVLSVMDGSGRAVYGFGSLMPDAGARLDLPAGFCCRVLSTVGDAMAIAGPWEQRSDAPQAS